MWFLSTTWFWRSHPTYSKLVFHYCHKFRYTGMTVRLKTQMIPAFYYTMARFWKFRNTSNSNNVLQETVKKVPQGLQFCSCKVVCMGAPNTHICVRPKSVSGGSGNYSRSRFWGWGGNRESANHSHFHSRIFRSRPERKLVRWYSWAKVLFSQLFCAFKKPFIRNYTATKKMLIPFSTEQIYNASFTPMTFHALQYSQFRRERKTFVHVDF